MILLDFRPNLCVQSMSTESGDVAIMTIRHKDRFYILKIT